MEILTTSDRQKIDESNDSIFYSRPRFVYHLDANFRRYLTYIYKKELENNKIVLDLMSSWDSYLPKDRVYKEVIGHGLNEEELSKNKSLNRYWIQNFNLNQKIPLESKSIDYCLMVAALQYLQYPEVISQEISRILSEEGKLIVSFTNRAFWSKAPNVWTNSNEEERVNYVCKVLSSNGFDDIRVIQEFISNRTSFLSFLNSDPFYCVIANKK